MIIKTYLSIMLLIPFSAMMVIAGEAQASGSAGQEIVLDKMIAESLANNPGLRATDRKRQAMGYRPAKEQGFSNPMFSYSGMDASGSGKFPNTAEKRYEIEQTLPWYGKRDSRGDIARRDADIAKSEYHAARLDLILAVKETYYDLYSVRLVVSTVRAEEALLKQIAGNVTARYSAGQSEQQDVLKAETELTMLQQRILELSTRENALRVRLNTLLNRNADSPLGEMTAPKPAGDIDKPATVADGKIPELVSAKARLDRNEVEYRLMKKEYYPDLKLGFEYRTFSYDAEDMLMFKIGLDLPVWQSRNKAAKNEAQKMVEAGKAELEAARKQSDFEINDAFFRVTSAKQSLSLYRQSILPQSELRYKASESAYQAGKAGFLDLIESERFLLNAKIMSIMAEAGLLIEIARLERVMGSDPDISN